MFRNKIFVLMCHCQQIVDLILTVSRSQWPRGLVTIKYMYAIYITY
jgi:hypothetical protein